MDTSFLVDLLKGNRAALRELEKLESDGESSTTTAISASELFEGAYNSKEKEKETKNVRELLGRIQLLDFDIGACERYGQLSRELRSLGRAIGDMDTLIASLAISHNEPLLTADIRHFSRVPGLIVRTWSRSNPRQIH
jgi:tRNA(fMet)-specific endonuclease VapC